MMAGYRFLVYSASPDFFTGQAMAVEVLIKIDAESTQAWHDAAKQH
jgi:hypothetical protein